MGEILNQQEARVELGKLSMTELRALAMEAMIPDQGQSKADLIELLLGNCVGCSKSRMKVVYEHHNHSTGKVEQKNQPEPCLGCGQR